MFSSSLFQGVGKSLMRRVHFVLANLPPHHTHSIHVSITVTYLLDACGYVLPSISVQRFIRVCNDHSN